MTAMQIVNFILAIMLLCLIGGIALKIIKFIFGIIALVFMGILTFYIICTIGKYISTYVGNVYSSTLAQINLPPAVSAFLRNQAMWDTLRTWIEDYLKTFTIGSWMPL